MANFLARALRYLGTQYLIEGSEVTTRNIDLSAVQLVQDVKSTLIAGRGLGRQDGWAVFIVDHTEDDQAAPASVTNLKFINPYDPANLINASGVNASAWSESWDPDEWDIWLYGTGLSYFQAVADTSIEDAQAYTLMVPSLRVSRDGDTTSAINRPNVVFQQFGATAKGSGITNVLQQMPSGPPGVTYPIFIPRMPVGITGVGTAGLFSRIRISLPGTDDGTNAITAQMAFYCRVVPRGLTP